MTDIEFTIPFGNQVRRVKITRPFRVGDVRYILVDDYLQGQLVKQASKWTAFLNRGSILTADDIAAIIEVVESQNPDG